MSKTRIKKTVGPAIGTREELEECVRRLTEATIMLQSAMAEMNDKITATRARYQKNLDELTLRVVAETDLAREWAMAHRGTQFAERKSLDLLHGTIGFRTGTPALKTLAKITWKRVIENLRALGLDRYIRTTEAVDREALIADRQAMDAEMAEIGVTVEQSETFFVEPRMDAVKE